MRNLIIANTDRFALISHGRGVAYTFCNKRACRDVFVQGDDADQFWSEFMPAFGSQSHKPIDAFFATLWSNYDCVSTPMHSAVEILDLLH